MPNTRAMTYELGTVAAGTVFNTANTTTYVTCSSVAAGNATGLAAGEIPVSGIKEIDLDFNISAISGSSAAVTVTVDRKGTDGVWYNVYSSGAKTATGSTSANIAINGGSTNVGIGMLVRIGVFLSNTTTPSATMSLSAIGKS